MENENLNTKEQNPVEEKVEDIQEGNDNIENENVTLTDEPKVEEQDSEIVTIEEENVGDIEEGTSTKRRNREKRVTFPMSFCAIMIDEAVCLGIAYVLELIVNQIMNAASGYVFNNTLEALSLIFIVLQILYVSIMESKFKGQTIGKILFNLKVVEK